MFPFAHVAALLLSAAPLLTSVVDAIPVLPSSKPLPTRAPWPVVQKVPLTRIGPVLDRYGAEIPSYDTVYYFDQLIDHNDPSLGTFKQRYWHTWEFYEPGGPIVLSTPGESNADGFESFLTNATIPGLIAQQQSGATVLLEHRYYGYSNPYPDLSVASLQLHTIQQAIDDLAYFAENVQLPMPGGDAVTPAQAPWVLVGGSYAGALTSFTKVNKPDVFYAAWSSSGVVESIVNFWGYFDIIRQFMPQNCSADLQAVIGHIDEVFTSNDTAAIDSLKTTFNMDLSHLDDFSQALTFPVSSWQGLQPSSELADSPFFEFCDAMEVRDGVNAPAEGWGLDYALQAYGAYWSNTYYPDYLCGSESAEECLGTYDASSPTYTNTSVNNAARSWYWTVCTEMGFFQDGAPEESPTIVSRLVEPSYFEHICSYYFPEAFSSPTAPQVSATNNAYDGWSVQADRLFFANGQRDPWRDATISADGTNFTSTALQPIAVGDGYHCSDLFALNAEDPTIASVQAQGLAAMQDWLEEWTPSSA